MATEIKPNGYINLAKADYPSPDPINVEGAESGSIQVKATTWGTATVKLQWSNDNETFTDFSPTITLSTSTTGKNNLSLGGVRYIRLVTSSADGTASSNAEVYFLKLDGNPFPFDFNSDGKLNVDDADTQTALTTTNTSLSTLDTTLQGVQTLGQGKVLTDMPGLNIARGKVSGISVRYVSGSNSAQGSGYEDLWYAGGNYNWQASAVSLEVVSSSASDTSGGLGARTVEVETLNSSWTKTTHTVTMNGTTAVALSGTHMRVNYAKVLTHGFGVLNFGDIDVRIASAGAILRRIVAAQGIDRDCIYSVPASHTAYLTRWWYGGDSDSVSTGLHGILLERTEALQGYTSSAGLVHQSGPSLTTLTHPHYERVYSAPRKFAAKSDLWLRLDGTSTSNVAAGGMDFIVLDNSLLAS